MTKSLRIVGLIALILGAFCSGAVISAIRGWGSSAVTLELKNQSGQPIQSFKVRYETCSTKASIAGEAVALGQSKKIYFSVCGEGGYMVEVTLANGNLLSTAGGYVESGYMVTEVVTANAINSTQSIYGL